MHESFLSQAPQCIEATSMKLVIANLTDSKFQTFPPLMSSCLFLICGKYKTTNQASCLSFSDFMALRDFHSHVEDTE